MNELAPDVSLTGIYILLPRSTGKAHRSSLRKTTILISVCRNDNPDAFSPHVFALLGYPHLSKLIKDTTFVHPTNQVLTISLISSPTAMDIKQHH